MLQNKIYVGMDISKNTIDFYNPKSTKHSHCARTQSSLMKHISKFNQSLEMFILF